MLGDLIAKDDVLDILGTEDRKILQDAQQCLASYLGQSADLGQWNGYNLQCQSSLGNLHCRISHLLGRIQLRSKRIMGDGLKDGEYDDIRSKDERLAIMLSNDVGYYDLNKQIIQLESLEVYCHDLLKTLRSSLYANK